MSEIVRERHVFRDPETALTPEKRERMRQRIANYAVQSVTQFILTYAPTPPTVNNKVQREFTHLPVQKDEVTAVANQFNVVADFAVENPTYFQRTAISKETFQRLHTDIEATAQRIDPLRSIRFIA